MQRAGEHVAGCSGETRQGGRGRSLHLHSGLSTPSFRPLPLPTSFFDRRLYKIAPPTSKKAPAAATMRMVKVLPPPLSLSVFAAKPEGRPRLSEHGWTGSGWGWP